MKAALVTLLAIVALAYARGNAPCTEDSVCAAEEVGSTCVVSTGACTCSTEGSDSPCTDDERCDGSNCVPVECGPCEMVEHHRCVPVAHPIACHVGDCGAGTCNTESGECDAQGDDYKCAADEVCSESTFECTPLDCSDPCHAGTATKHACDLKEQGTQCDTSMECGIATCDGATSECGEIEPDDVTCAHNWDHFFPDGYNPDVEQVVCNSETLKCEIRDIPDSCEGNDGKYSSGMQLTIDNCDTKECCSDDYECDFDKNECLYTPDDSKCPNVGDGFRERCNVESCSCEPEEDFTACTEPSHCDDEQLPEPNECQKYGCNENNTCELVLDEEAYPHSKHTKCCATADDCMTDYPEDLGCITSIECVENICVRNGDNAACPQPERCSTPVCNVYTGECDEHPIQGCPDDEAYIQPHDGSCRDACDSIESCDGEGEEGSTPATRGESCYCKDEAECADNDDCGLASLCVEGVCKHDASELCCVNEDCEREGYECMCSAGAYGSLEQSAAVSGSGALSSSSMAPMCAEVGECLCVPVAVCDHASDCETMGHACAECVEGQCEPRECETSEGVNANVIYGIAIGFAVLIGLLICCCLITAWFRNRRDYRRMR